MEISNEEKKYKLNINSELYCLTKIINSKYNKYNIPMYQRGYCWSEKEVTSFMQNVFSNFWEIEESDTEITKIVIKSDPFFIGTMLFSPQNNPDNESITDVIDGQQRLSTFLCLMKYLKIKNPDNETLKNKNLLNFLKTTVSEVEQGFLEQLINYTNEDNDLETIQNQKNYSANQYLKNLLTIKNVFEENTIKHDKNLFEETNQSEIKEKFIDFILNKIQFVVITSEADIYKSISIFNSLNTTGLDLNISDIFKIRLYDYLKKTQKNDSNVLSKIVEVYEKVSKENVKWKEKHSYDLITMNRVLQVYKDYLISKNKLSTSFYSQGITSFYENLFKDKEKDLLNNILDDLNDVIDVILSWGKSEYTKKEQVLSYTIIVWSRYPNFENIAYQILLARGKEQIDQVYKILLPLSKMVFCYSLYYARQVYECRSSYNNILRDLYDNDNDYIIKGINKIIREFTNEVNFKDNVLGKQIAGKWNWKYLMCFLSDYLAGEEYSTDELKENYLETEIDIEHIHATENTGECLDIEDDLQHSIGNLMLLERDKNRRIGNKKFSDKKSEYKDSSFKTAKIICQKKHWEIEDIKTRKEEEINAIYGFLTKDLNT